MSKLVLAQEFRCKYCGKTFQKQQELSGHISAIHLANRSGIPIHPCKVCGEAVVYLRNHNGGFRPIPERETRITPEDLANARIVARVLKVAWGPIKACRLER